MNNGDIWDTVLGNGSGGSATPLTGILGNVGSGGSPPPDFSSSVNLASRNPAGIGGDSITPLLLPRLQDTSAALLPPSAFAPSQPLYDPAPFAPPELTMDQLAMMYGMSPDQVAAIRNGAETQTWVSGLAKGAFGPAATFALPEAGVPDLVAEAIGGGIDVRDLFDLAQRLRTAPDEAVYKNMNDTMNQNLQAQNVPPAWRAFP